MGNVSGIEELEKQLEGADDEKTSFYSEDDEKTDKAEERYNTIKASCADGVVRIDMEKYNNVMRTEGRLNDRQHRVSYKSSDANRMVLY